MEKEIILNLYKEAELLIAQGHGPFLAAVVDEDGKIVAKGANSVLKDCNCLNHAEINAIKNAQKVLGCCDLSPFNLSIYVTAEPCLMCVGAIMWSGIRRVYYGVNSADVEAITGFDEGFKPNWHEEFLKRGIEVLGCIEEPCGKALLQKYVDSGHKIYKPSRQRSV